MKRFFRFLMAVLVPLSILVSGIIVHAGETNTWLQNQYDFYHATIGGKMEAQQRVITGSLSLTNVGFYFKRNVSSSNHVYVGIKDNTFTTIVETDIGLVSDFDTTTSYHSGDITPTTISNGTYYFYLRVASGAGSLSTGFKGSDVVAGSYWQYDGSSWSEYSGGTTDLAYGYSYTTYIVPTVVIGDGENTALGEYVWLTFSSETTVTEAGIQWGESTGNYTDNVSGVYATTGSANYFLIPATSLEYGHTYYYQGFALNDSGYGYSDEKSFTFEPALFTISYQPPLFSKKGSSDNYSVSIIANLSPIEYSADATMSAILGDEPYQDDYSLTGIELSPGTWIFNTDGWPLSPNTDYWFQATATYNGTDYVGPLQAILTTSNVTSFIDGVTIIDVSELWQQNYRPVLQLKSRVSSTHAVQKTGFFVSVSANGTYLIPPVFNYVDPNAGGIDGRFEVTLFLGAQSWYSDNEIFIQSYAIDSAETLRSNIYNWSPLWDTTGGDNPGTPTSVIPPIDKQVASLKAKYGLTGTMGSWAFMGIILLILALLFGIAMIGAKDYGKVAVGAIALTWILASAATVGAFLFSGELGTMSIVIAVGVVVVAVMVFAGVKLNGNSGGV